MRSPVKAPAPGLESGSLLANQLGQYAAAFILILVPGLVIVTGMMLEIGDSYSMKAKMQTAVDSSLIAVAQEYRIREDYTTADLERRLRENFEFNMKANSVTNCPAGDTACLGGPIACLENDVSPSDPDYESEKTYQAAVDSTATQDQERNKLRITCSLRRDTRFARLLFLLGLNSIDLATVRASGDYAFYGGHKPLAVAFIIDGAVQDQTSGGTAQVKAALHAALDLLDPGDYVLISTYRIGYNGSWESGTWQRNIVSPFAKIVPAETAGVPDEKTVASMKAAVNALNISTVLPGNDHNFGQGGLYLSRSILRWFSQNNLASKDYELVNLFLTDGQRGASTFYNVTGSPPPSPITDYAIPELGWDRLAKISYPNCPWSPPVPPDQFCWDFWNSAAGTTLPSGLALDLNFQGGCNKASDLSNYAKSSNALLSEQADLARADAQKVFVFCNDCTSDARRLTAMRRVAIDRNLIDCWIRKSSICTDTGEQADWEFRGGNPNARCGGYLTDAAWSSKVPPVAERKSRLWSSPNFAGLDVSLASTIRQLKGGIMLR